VEATAQQQQPGLLSRVAAGVKEFVEADKKKIGGMTFGAHMRLGLAELRAAAALGGNVEQPTPLGMYGTMTPGEVGAARENENGDVRRMEEEPRREDARAAVTPSEIARDPGPLGKDHEQGKEQDMNIKPSEIARDNTQQRPDQDHSRDREQERGR
jgi:hypothetical protein